MVIGHIALGFGLKKVEPRVSLATSFLATQLADILWPILVLAGVEQVTIAPGETAAMPLRFDSSPWSHSLLTLALLGALFAGVHFFLRKQARAAALLGLLVLSHWVLDYISHRPDMPLAPWSTQKFGLGLWNSVIATVVLEGALFAAGVALAVTATRPRDRIGRWGLVAVVAVLALAYANGILGPPPPSVPVIGWSGIVFSLVLFLALAWIDRHREPAR